MEFAFFNLEFHISFFKFLNKTKLTNYIKEVIFIKICPFYAWNDEINFDNDILNLFEIKDIISLCKRSGATLFLKDSTIICVKYNS